MLQEEVRIKQFSRSAGPPKHRRKGEIRANIILRTFVLPDIRFPEIPAGSGNFIKLFLCGSSSYTWRKGVEYDFVSQKFALPDFRRPDNPARSENFIPLRTGIILIP